MSGRTRKVVVRESTGSRVLEMSRLRLVCVALFFALCFGSIAGKVILVTVISPRVPAAQPVASQEGEDAEDAEVTNTEQRIKRGDIVDRNGVLLATSLMTASAFANPREITDPMLTATQLEKAVGVPRGVLLKRLVTKKTFAWIKRHMSPAEQQAVNDLGIPGVYFLPEERRVYPFGNATAHVVGYVGMDNTGLAGIEKSFDRELSDEHFTKDPLTLSIDMRVQHILRDEMKRAMEEFKAIGAMGAVMDIKTGEMLAMASLPDFDPNQPQRAKDIQKFNRVTLGAYEMGSTFKSFTFAMALDRKVVNMKSGYDVSNPLKYGNFTITDTHPKKRWLSLPEIYAYSSNIGTAKMQLDVGVKQQKAFMKKLGMLEPVEIELPERAQPLFPKDWQELSGITVSYGHGISVTPLHLLRGIGALTNGGVLTPLTLLKGGNREREEGERVISADTSAHIRRLMRLVVTHGTATRADATGYRVGGKTGTAEKVQATGGYSKDSKIASFVGVFPVDAPRYAVLVMVDEPKGNKSTGGYATGGWVAAPSVGRIVARMAPLAKVRPEFETAADDAEKYWYDTDRKSSQQATRIRNSYIHDASFAHR